MNWKEPQIYQLLTEYLDHKNANVKRRAALALGKLGAEEPIRRIAAGLICKDVAFSGPVEQKCVAEALGALKIMDEEVGNVLLSFLENEYEDVKRAAGKALSELNE